MSVSIDRPRLPHRGEPEVLEHPSSSPVNLPGSVERAASGETIRISAAKLDARLLEAEEMLVAKLTARQRAADLRELAGSFDGWAKRWATLQPEIRLLRHRMERAELEVPPALASMLEFVDWNEDYLRSLQGRAAALSRTAEQDRQVVGKAGGHLLEDSKKLLMLPLSTMGALFPGSCGIFAASRARRRNW
ncbi:MAG: hypothetical protein QM796_13860 [Chthoniobacteraceae bacterium]